MVITQATPDWWIETAGYSAAAAGLYSTYARTMIPLRTASIVANVLFIAYGVLKGIYPTILVNCVLLPLNFVRLRDIRRLIGRVRSSAEGDLNFDWLRSFVTRKTFRAGETLWEMGQAADFAVYVLGGQIELVEIGVTVGEGQLIGEMGLFNKSRQRMLSARCLTDVEAGIITYDEFRLLYFQNPEFGFYLLSLITARMQESFQKVASPAGRAAFQATAPRRPQPGEER